MVYKGFGLILEWFRNELTRSRLVPGKVRVLEWVWCGFVTVFEWFRHEAHYGSDKYMP
jgi:hypothetical protein